MKREELLIKLQEKGLTLSSCESLTGGLFASCFTSIPQASTVFKGALVTYTNDSKKRAGIKGSTLKNYGAISKKCADEMALAASSFFSSNVSVSFTGNAGPTAQEGKEIGLVFISIKINDHLHSYELNLKGDRDEIRKQCVDFALLRISELIDAL